MGRPELAAQQRMQLEAVLEEFEHALRTSSDGALPDMEMYLTGFQGESREYLEREMRTLMKDLVRGNYVVLNPIESGGMGAISKVRHLRLGKVMALKEIRADALQIGDQKEILRRFHREIEVCGRLDEHPNIVSYTDTGVNESGVPFLVMDYIDGEDLGKIVRRVGPLPVNDAARIIHDAAIGLAHAHDNGLVHRDVKPSNIMVSRHGTVKVLDFGLARITNSEHQLTALTSGKVMGTFDYMSPELCREITPDHRGDIYSLGCTLYFLLAGRAPYEASKSQFDKMNAHLHAEPAAIPRLDGHPELRATLQKMMAKDPDARQQDLHQVAEALLPYCEGSDLRRLMRSEKSRGGGGSVSGGILLRADRPHDSSSRTTDSKAGDRTAAWSELGRRGPSRQFLWTAFLLILGAVIVGALVVADHWRQTQHRRELEVVLGTLPGVNGRWWFEETPWLLPEVRMQLAQSLADADEESRTQLLEAIYENPSAPQAYELLEEFRKRFRRRWPDDVQSHVTTFESLDPELVNAEQFAEFLRGIAAGFDSRPRESLAGYELHLRAVIHHHLEEFDAAVRLYTAADERYAAEGEDALRSLALLDWAQLLHDFRQPGRAQGKFREAYQRLVDARPGRPLPPLFELYVKAMEADQQRRIDNTPKAEELLARAWEIASTLPDKHPLRAFVYERRGWLNLDLWRLEESRADFETALAIRESHEPENHRARHFIYWDKQGVAMVQMYDGRSQEARKLYLDLLQNIDAGSTNKQRRELEERGPNLHERLADTVLYNGDDAGTEVDPAEALENAIEEAVRQKFAADGRKGVLIRLQYKAAVVYAMRGDRARAEAHLDAARAMAEESAGGSSAPRGGGRRSSYAVTRDIAEAAFQWRLAAEEESQRRQGRKDLTELIARADPGLPRDDLLLLLYAAEQLLESKELAPEEDKALAKQIQQLIRLEGFSPPPPGASASELAAPGVFVRYWMLADVALGAKE